MATLPNVEPCTVPSPADETPLPRNMSAASPVAAPAPKLPAIVSMACGAASGTLSCILWQPLDLTKTRLQCSSARASGLTARQVLRDVVATQGPRGLYRGLNVSLARTVPGVAMYFGMLNAVKSHIQGPCTPMQDMAIGMSSRIAVGTFLVPLTVVKTRVESGVFQYAGVGNALVTIRSTEGLRGLYSGSLATALRDAPFSGVYLASYNALKRWGKAQDSGLPSVVISVGSGVVAGALATCVTMPQDNVKTAMQMQPNRFRNAFAALTGLVQEEGAASLFRGLGPRLLRRSLVPTVSWVTYEQLSPVLLGVYQRAAGSL